MSSQTTSNSSNIPVTVSNWRRVLNNNRRALNCPCRRNKKDYANVRNLLYHIKKRHPEYFENAEREYRQRTRTGRQYDVGASDPASDVMYEPDTSVGVDWDNSDMQIIMENPSNVADVIVDEDSDERDVVREHMFRDDLTIGAEDILDCESDEESETEAELNDIQYYEDYRQFMNIIMPFSTSLNMAETNGSEEPLPNIDQIQQAINSVSEPPETIHDTGSSPYPNMATFLLHALFFGDEDLASERSIKKIIYAMELLLELKTKDDNLTLPSPDAIFNYHNRVKNRIPVFKATEYQARNRATNKTETFFMNNVSEYIKHGMADPVKSKKLSALPDDTPDELMNLQQGTKWKEHWTFQHPMITTSSGHDIWVGDVVPTLNSSAPYLLVSRFFTRRNGNIYMKYASGFEVFFDVPTEGSIFGVSVESVDVLLDNLGQPIDKRLISFEREGYSVKKMDNGVLHVVDNGLMLQQYHLWFNKTQYESFKRRKTTDGSLMKVVNVPIILFSDDTSGNKSKQYNKYDRFLMVPAALSFEERNSRENHNFICTSNKTLSAVDMLPPLVDDLCLLEKGIEMYSAQYDEYVLVVSPLLFISGDNPRHSQLVMHRGTCSSFYCRKCLIPRPANPNIGKKENLVHLNCIVHEGHPRRTREFLDQFNKASTDSEIYKKGHSLSYANNGSEEFLHLKSFDGTLDVWYLWHIYI